MIDEIEDFVWCTVRWTVAGPPHGPHQCAENRPGHTVHVCCCGAEFA